MAFDLKNCQNQRVKTEKLGYFEKAPQVQPKCHPQHIKNNQQYNWKKWSISSHLGTRRRSDTKEPKFPPCRNWPICASVSVWACVMCIRALMPVWVFAKRAMLKLLHQLSSSRTQWAVAEQRAGFECCWLGKPGPVSLSVSVCAPLNRNTHVAGLESCNIVMPPFAKTTSKIFIFVN